MNNNRLSLIIATIILSVATICFGGLFLAQTSRIGGLENTISTRDKEIAELRKELSQLKEKETKKDEVEKTSYDEKTIIKATSDNGNIGDHIRGKTDSKVVVIEYADMACPGCAAMMPHMSNIYKEYGDKVAFVFRHYPLAGHQNARSAAAAVESAGLQGYFWEMLEAMFTNRADWLYGTDTALTNAYVNIFKKVAPQGDEAKFRNSLDDENIKKKITFDYSIGHNQSKVDATPSVYINGEAIDFTSPDATTDSVAKDIKNKIEAELKK